MKKNVALITGTTIQAGSYLVQEELNNKYKNT